MDKELAPIIDRRKIYEVKERYNRCMPIQVKYIPAHTRVEAKDIYTLQYRKYPNTRLTANLASSDMRQYISPMDKPPNSYKRLKNRAMQK